MKSLKTLMYSGIKYFFCLLYTNSLLHFCAPGAKFFSRLTSHVEVELSEGCLTQTSHSVSYLFPVATALKELR